VQLDVHYSKTLTAISYSEITSAFLVRARPGRGAGRPDGGDGGRAEEQALQPEGGAERDDGQGGRRAVGAQQCYRGGWAPWRRALEELPMAGEQQQELEETVETVRVVLVATIRRDVNLVASSGGDGGPAAGGGHCYQQVNKLTRRLQGDEASIHVSHPGQGPDPVAAVRGGNGALTQSLN